MKGYEFIQYTRDVTIKIPPSAYEISEINKTIQNLLLSNFNIDEGRIDMLFSIQANNNTLECELESLYDIDLGRVNSIASLLGFEPKGFKGNQKYESTKLLAITHIHIIRVDCNITSGTYMNGNEAHTLLEFDVDIELGYNLSKEAKNIIYMPIRAHGRQCIENITVRILDDNGRLIDFRGEKVIVKLKLKALG